MPAAGILSAALTPVFTFLTIWVNKTRLPKAYQPKWITVIIVTVAGLFSTTASILVFLNLFGIQLLGGGGS